MKKIMTLLLVAMLLVTAIPFTAFATEGNGFTEVQLWIDGTSKETDSWSEGNGDPRTKTPKDMMERLFAEYIGKYDFKSAAVYDSQRQFKGEVGYNDTIESASTPIVIIKLASKGVYRAKISFKQYGSGEWIADKVIEKVDNGSGAPKIFYEDIANVMPRPQEGMESYSIAEVRTPGNNTLNPGNFYTGEYGKEEWFTAYVNVTNNGQGQTPASKNVTLTVMNGSTTVMNTKTIELDGDSAQLKKILYYHWDKTWTDKYNYSSDSLGRGLEGTIYGGENVTVYVTSKSSKPDPEPTVKEITYIITIGTTADNAKESFRGTFTPAQNGASKVGDILTNKWNSKWKNSYKFENAYVKGVGDLGENDYVKAGQTVTIRVSSKSSSGGSTGGGHNKFPYNVYLHVYLNNNLDSAHKTFDITDGIAADGVVDKNDIWNNLLKNYYSAKDSKGVKIELYKATGNWVKDFAADNQVSSINNILDLRDDGYVHINVVLNNAKSKTSSSNADPNNPKTGDSIGTVISVMGLSATALATMFFFNKKRIFG